MKTILLLSAIVLSQSVFAKTLQEEAQDRILKINQASRLRAEVASGRLKEISSLLAVKLTGSIVASVEEASGPAYGAPQNPLSVYLQLSQTSQYSLKMVNGDLCFITLQNTAQPHTLPDRKIELAGTISATKATCIGSQGETVATTVEDYGGPIGSHKIMSLGGVGFNTHEPVARYTYSSFEVKIK